MPNHHINDPMLCAYFYKGDEMAKIINEKPTLDAKIECSLSSKELKTAPSIIGA